MQGLYIAGYAGSSLPCRFADPARLEVVAVRVRGCLLRELHATFVTYMQCSRLLPFGQGQEQRQVGDFILPARSSPQAARDGGLHLGLGRNPVMVNYVMGIIVLVA